MYVNINNKNYTRLFDLSFDPQADITGAEIVINQFVVTIKTDDTINVGDTACLYDDLDNLWAKYRITDADRYDEFSCKVVAKSPVLLLDRKKLPAKMYSSMSVASAVAEVMGDIPYTIDPSITGSVSGFAPEQSARERLQWICFCLGAYVKSFFNDKLQILDVGEDVVAIPLSKTFWKPSISYADYVSAIKVRTYAYRQGTPETTDKYVTPDDSTYYIETTQDVTISNPNVPAAVPENVIEFTDVKLVNSTNVSEIASRLSTNYFMRMEIDADVVNNAEFIPAEKYALNYDGTHLIEGYMKSADFSFGVQARSRIKLGQARAIDAVTAIIRYLWDAVVILRQVFYLPKNYGVTFETKWIEWQNEGHRYIFIPATDSISGSTGESGVTLDVQNSVALDMYNGNLLVVSVDEVSSSGGVVSIE